MPTDWEKINRRVSALRNERETFIDYYKDLAQFVSPRRGRFYVTDRNRGSYRGSKRWGSIINSRATWALRIAMAGLFTGLMSPSRPWHWLRPVGDPELAEYQPVRDWIHVVVEQQREIFRRSNLYNAAPIMLKELLLFGTACISHENDDKTLARFYPETAGSYMIAQDDTYRVNAIVREKEMTADQIVRRFGNNGRIGDNISPSVKNAYDLGNYDAWFAVTHMVYENPDYKEDSPFNNEMRFKSIYFEPSHRDKYLSESGFRRLPFYCPRWEVTGEDVYGTECPGMVALGDVRSLQMAEKLKAKAVHKMVDPQLKAPPSLKNQRISDLPGSVVITDATTPGATVGPIYQVDPRVQEMGLDIARIEERIDRAFYVDLFQAISSMEGVQPRNQLELTQRNQERLLQLGPTLERLHGDFLANLIDRIFEQQIEANLLPPPPAELEGQELEVQFVSALAMAQLQAATGNVERLAGFTASLAQSGYPDVLDKFDADQAVDLMAELTGTPPEVVRSDEDVASIRRNRAQQQQALVNAEREMQEADVAAKLGNVKVTEDTVAGQAAGG